MVEWIIGIFTVMSVMVTIIGIIIATRFLYIDNHYSKMINDQEKFIAEQEKIIAEQEKSNDDVESEYDIIPHINSYQRAIGFYKSKQNNNKREGVILDFSSLFLIVIFALFTTQGYFKDSTSLLNVLLFLLFLTPLVHFLTHILVLEKKNQNLI